MTEKRENKIENMIDYVGDSAYDLICGEFDDCANEHSFKTIRDYAPYGDTEVEVCQFIDEDDEIEFRENIEDYLNVDTVIEKLAKDKAFRDSIKDMIDYVKWNRDIEV